MTSNDALAFRDAAMSRDPARTFVARRQELAGLTRLLDAAAARPRLAVVRGAAGMGKTSLIQKLLEDNQGLPVLRGSGAQWETGLEGGVLQQLFPAGGMPQDPAVLLDVLRESGGPAILWVDNLHWVDHTTLRALLFAIRRLRSEKLLVILSLTDEEAHRLPAGCRDLIEDPPAAQLTLGPMKAAEIRELALHGAGVELSAPAAHQLTAHAGGNPRHTLQLLRENPPEVWHRWNPHLPAPAALVHEAVRRLTALRDDSRRLIEAAAVLGMAPALAETAALAGTGDPLPALDEASRTGILAVSGAGRIRTVSFASPVLRAAVYDSMALQRRVALHLAASSLVQDQGAALAHRAAASLLPDPGLAGELEAYAAGQAEIGAWSNAADALFQSGQLFASSQGREARLLRALDAMVGAGELPRALTYADEIGNFASSTLRDAVTGYIAILQGRQTQAEVLLEHAWNYSNPLKDPGTVAMIAQRRVLDSLARWNGTDLLMWAQRAGSLAEAGSPAAIESEVIKGLGLAALGRTEEAEAGYAALLTRRDLGAQKQRVQMAMGWLHLALDQVGTAREELSAAVSTEFSAGSFRIALWAQAWLARAEFAAGNWDQALQWAERGVILQERVGMDLVRPLLHWTAAQVHALRGNWDAAAEHLDRSRASAGNYPVMLLPFRLAQAQIAEARADYEGVVTALEPVRRLACLTDIDEPGFWPWQDVYANALVMTDRVREASDFLLPLEALAAARGHRSAAARMASVRGRILAAEGEIESAKTSFESGLLQLEGLDLPVERARLNFAYGQSLRRAGKRREAAGPLALARDLYSWMGAGTYVERCERELQASGMNLPRRDGVDFLTLTAQENAVAELVAAGASNKQAAQELFVSVKTVQYHLTRIYAKLGVGSRSELAARYRPEGG